MSDLAEAVLPLIRTRADLWRWSTANEHGRQMHEAVAILRQAAESDDPAVVFAVTQKAIASALKVIMRADDSSGIIGDACRAPRRAGRGPARGVSPLAQLEHRGRAVPRLRDHLADVPRRGHAAACPQSARRGGVRAVPPQGRSARLGAGPRARPGSDRAWSDLVKAYEKVDPSAVLPVLNRLAAGSEHDAEVDWFIAELRETNRRRPRLQQEFDRAGLP